MDNGPVVWDQFNRRHLTDDHPERGISVAEVEQAMGDPHRIDDTVQRLDGLYGAIIGRMAAGRLLYVAYVRRNGGRYPVHARRASRRLVRRYDSDERSG